MWGRALTAGVAVLVALGYLILAHRAATVDRIAHGLDVEIQEAERDTKPRPPLFGDPVPGLAVDHYSEAERLLHARCTLWQLKNETRRTLVRLGEVVEAMSRGARTEQVGSTWDFPSGRARQDLCLVQSAQMGLALREDALRLADAGEPGRAVDRLLVLVRYAEDLRRCGWYSMAVSYIEATAETFDRIGSLLPRSEVERPRDVLRREIEIGAMGGFARRAVLLTRQRWRLSHEGRCGMSYWACVAWRGRELPRPVNRVCRRAIELFWIPDALSTPVEGWNSDSVNPAIRMAAGGLRGSRQNDEAQSRALEALVADLSDRLR